MFEVALTLGGAVLGFLLSAAYERWKERRVAHHVRLLLSRELAMNEAELRALRAIFQTYSAPDRPAYIAPITPDELAQRVTAACHRDSFEACRRDLPVIGQEALEAVFTFYDQAARVPKAFTDHDRFATNIRHGLIEDYIDDLVARASQAEKRVAA